MKQKPYLATYKPPAFYTKEKGGWFEKWPNTNVLSEELLQIISKINVENVQVEDLTVHALFWVRFSDREIDFIIERWDCKNGFTDYPNQYNCPPEVKVWVVGLFKSLGILPHE